MHFIAVVKEGLQEILVWRILRICLYINEEEKCKLARRIFFNPTGLQILN